jgi:hypothetical protein
LLGGLVLLLTAFYVGACLQRIFVPSLTDHSGDRGVLRSSLAGAAPATDKKALDALFMQVGVLQAHYQRLETLSWRLGSLAGLAASELQIVAEYETSATPRAGGELQTLARIRAQLRALQVGLVKKTDQFMLLDHLLTKRAATFARQPTAPPIASLAQLSSAYGWRRHPFHTEPSMHEGLDFAAPAGTPIFAESGGVVRTAAYQGGFGNLIEIDHGEGLLTRYAHAKVLLVKKGDLVARGKMIARVGSTGLSTGPHLHFEVRKHDQPLDPRTYLTGSLVAP